jgi:cellulose synthase/poly-beta-1,6-N-acetylglucosamine synthase-like glycosyltransferase
MKKDWLKELKKVNGKNWKDIYHVIILPTYKEGKEIIEESIETLIKSEYPKEKMIVVLAVEERAGQIFEKQARVIAKKYSDKFYKFLVAVHPDGIKGEIAGKGSNTAFAGKEVKGKVIDKFKIPCENILISTFDIDTKVFPQYFACLTWYYLTEKNPMGASYQPVPVYNNNIWSASALNSGQSFF